MSEACIERGCDEPAGTPWTPLWCMKHDEERRARITAQLESIAARLEPATINREGETPPQEGE